MYKPILQGKLIQTVKEKQTCLQENFDINGDAMGIYKGWFMDYVSQYLFQGETQACNSCKCQKVYSF